MSNKCLFFPKVTPVIINQQNGSPLQTQAIALDLKANGMPTLVTDSNGNHYLIALTRQNGVSSLAKVNGRITLQVAAGSCRILSMKSQKSPSDALLSSYRGYSRAPVNSPAPTANQKSSRRPSPRANRTKRSHNNFCFCFFY